MKKSLYILYITILVFASCDPDENTVFEKTADERAAEAIADLKNELTAPANGWRVNYTPESGSGSYYVLMNFNEDNTVRIRTDLGANDGEFFDQTITYRIDNSMGLELIFESYSFFSYLFELDDATFGAEYEYTFVNKTSDDALVFRSKTDFTDHTIFVMQRADADDESLFGRTLATNLDEFTSGAKITFENRDIEIYLSLNPEKRTVDFNFISLKNNLQSGQSVNHETGYLIQGDSIIFNTPFSNNFNNSNLLIKSLRLTEFSEVPESICPTPSTAPSYKGFTSGGDAVTLEATLFNADGAAFRDSTPIYLLDPLNIRDENGQRVDDQIAQDIVGANVMLIYNNYQGINAIGFYIVNPDGTDAIVVREMTSTFNGNVVEVQFASEITILRGSTDANINNIDIYLNKLTEGGRFYAYRYNETFYQLYNPCSGWTFYFQILEV